MALVLATISYAVVPGPGTIYIAGQVIVREPRAALWGALGLHIGGYVIVFGSAAGLMILFSAVPVIYEGLKLLGAGYLVWLGVQMIAGRSGTQETDRRYHPAKRQPATFSQGVLVELLNPTTVVFYVAFLPQFVAPAGGAPVWFQLLIFGVVVNLIFSLCDLLTILVAARIKTGVIGSAAGRRLFGWIGGSVLVLLGLRLVAGRS